MNADDKQIEGDHYKKMSMQPWTVIEAWMTPEQFRGFLLGSAIAYLARFNVEGVSGKGGVVDVEKAHHYLQKLIEVCKHECK